MDHKGLVTLSGVKFSWIFTYREETANDNKLIFFCFGREFRVSISAFAVEVDISKKELTYECYDTLTNEVFRDDKEIILDVTVGRLIKAVIEDLYNQMKGDRSKAENRFICSLFEVSEDSWG